MKLLSASAIAALLLTAAQAMALPNQPALIPADGDYGVYAVQAQVVGPTDPDLAKAYDNFSLGADYNLLGFEWSGIYAEAFPTTPSDTDFIVEIWNIDPANSNLADVGSGPVLSFSFEGGATAGVGGADLTVTALGYTSPATATTFGGGEAFSYDADVPSTMLAAGDYWISILADQSFDNKIEIDPEWQWHLGTGPGDGFATFDRTLDPPGTLQAGTLQDGKDLAFAIRGELVPEPNSALMAAFGLLSLGLIRRKRS